MKLLFAIDGLGSGGAQRQLVNLALGLTRRGHTIELFLYHPEYKHFEAELKSHNIIILAYTKRHKFSLGPVLALQKILYQRNYDGILAFLPTPSFYAEIVSVAHPQLPLVISERFMYTAPRLPIKIWALQQCHRRADYITVNSHHQRVRMENKFPWMKKKIRTIYNGINLEIFAPTTKRESCSSKARLLVLSTIKAKKNPLGLIRALRIVKENSGDICQINWAGKVDFDSRSREEFEIANRMLEEFNLTHSWQWLGERQDVVELLHNHDALIHPSFFEGLPNAICEALACGKPVLASNICDHPLLVQDKISGLLFDPTKPEEIAKTIQEFASLSLQERADMGSAGRHFAEQNLSLEQYTTNYESLFLELSHQKSLESK